MNKILIRSHESIKGGKFWVKENNKYFNWYKNSPVWIVIKEIKE